jgi:hypothetical protein
MDELMQMLGYSMAEKNPMSLEFTTSKATVAP